MEIKNNSGIIEISSDSTVIYFDTNSLMVKISDLPVSFAGEYEKGGILLEVKEYENKLFYSFTLEGKNLLIITDDKFEQKEEILSFFGDVDILLMIGTKEAVKIFESIEARVIIPYGDTKDLFLNALSQQTEEEHIFKLKSDLPSEETMFVNLA